MSTLYAINYQCQQCRYHDKTDFNIDFTKLNFEDVRLADNKLFCVFRRSMIVIQAVTLLALLLFLGSHLSFGTFSPVFYTNNKINKSNAN